MFRSLNVFCYVVLREGFITEATSSAGVYTLIQVTRAYVLC